MSASLPAAARRVQEALRARGFPNQVVEMPASTRSAAEAARAVGCTVGQIAKSLVFRGARSGRAVLVIASGANRVDENRLADAAGEPVAMAEPAFVREATGYAIGGVPPLGHARPLVTFIDEDLMAHAEIWAAAGTPRAVFRLTPDELVTMTGGTVAGLKPR